MVLLSAVQASNAQITTALPAGMVAVFVGSTSGIGEYSMKTFAKLAKDARIYFVGRSQESADRIIQECRLLNSGGQYNFLQADTSLIKNVDRVCDSIKAKETAINALFLSTGSLVLGQRTSEGLHSAPALATYTRNRFIVNLLPLIERAKGLRRVLTVFGGTHEGKIFEDDYDIWKFDKYSYRAMQGHVATIVTLSLEHFAQQAPTVSFIHDDPGPVKSNIIRGGEGWMVTTAKFIQSMLAPLINIPDTESGERHCLMLTSARYPARQEGDGGNGVPIGELTVVRGTDGEDGSGVYSLNHHNESAGPKVEAFLAGLRKDGMVEKVWREMERQYADIVKGTGN